MLAITNIIVFQIRMESLLRMNHDFKEAFEFMTLCAQRAEEIDHHPDWSNSWNKVSVHLSTHSSKGLTALDIQMAKAMDILALQVKVNP